MFAVKICAEYPGVAWLYFGWLFGNFAPLDSSGGWKIPYSESTAGWQAAIREYKLLKEEGEALFGHVLAPMDTQLTLQS